VRRTVAQGLRLDRRDLQGVRVLSDRLPLVLVEVLDGAIRLGLRRVVRVVRFVDSVGFFRRFILVGFFRFFILVGFFRFFRLLGLHILRGVRTIQPVLLTADHPRR